MASHLLLLVVFAVCVSTVFAVLMREDARSQVKTAAWMLGAFVGAALVLGWIMYPVPF